MAPPRHELYVFKLDGTELDTPARTSGAYLGPERRRVHRLVRSATFGQTLVVLPVPRTERERHVLEAVFDLLRLEGRWPIFDVLDRHLDGRNVPDAEDLLLGMPDGLVRGVSTTSRPIRDDQEIGLTLAGLAAVPGADEDVTLFLALVKLAAELEAERLPSEPAATLDASIAGDRLPLPAAGQAQLLARAEPVLAAEWWGWTQHAPATPERSWSFTFDRRVRKFRDMSSLEDYWDLAHDDPAPKSPLNSSMATTLPTRTPDTSAGWLHLLHPSVAQAAVPRLAAGHADNAVEEAWKGLAARLRLLTGLDLDGADLVNRALGKDGTVAFGARDTEHGRNQHDGITNLLRGLVQIGRNVRAHRPSPSETDGTEIAALLLVASMCHDRLDVLADHEDDPVPEG